MTDSATRERVLAGICDHAVLVRVARIGLTDHGVPAAELPSWIDRMSPGCSPECVAAAVREALAEKGQDR
jgi:hypothetical protein